MPVLEAASRLDQTMHSEMLWCVVILLPGNVVIPYTNETSSPSSTASYNVRKEVLKCSFLAICKLLFLL